MRLPDERFGEKLLPLAFAEIEKPAMKANARFTSTLPEKHHSHTCYGIPQTLVAIYLSEFGSIGFKDE